MLSPADQSVVHRDPAIPGLGVLLDDDALSDWLGTHIHTHVQVQAHYLRYKPGTSCVLAAELVGGSTRQPCLFWAYARSEFVKMTKTVHRAPLPSVLGVDLRRGVLASTPAGDRDLPGLRHLLQEDRRERLLGRLLPDRDVSDRSTLQVLRHKPGRRWVGLVDGRSHPPVVIRVYPPALVSRPVDAITAWGDGRPHTPRLLGKLPRKGVVAVEYLDGTVLSAQSPAAADAVFRSAGAALAQLHSRHDVALPDTVPCAEAKAAQAAGRHVGLLIPELHAEAQVVSRGVAVRLDQLKSARVPLHGDFSPDQVVLGPRDEIGLIDLDAAHLGAPATDLACAAAAITYQEVTGLCSLDEARRRIADLHAGYESVRPLPHPDLLAAHAAAQLLRRAVEPFRLRCADWPHTTSELVRRARSTLDPLTVAGGA